MSDASPKAGIVEVESPGSTNSLQDTSHPIAVTPTRHDDRELSSPVVGYDGSYVSSRAVSWWSVIEYVQPVLDRIGSWPMVGTPEWVALPDDSPAKIAAVLDAARHWAFRLEIRQEQMAEASRAVSAVASWADIAKQMTRRRGAYIPRCRHE